MFQVKSVKQALTAIRGTSSSRFARLVLVASLASACSGGSNDASPTTTIVEKPFGVTLISEAMPKAPDLPSGWTMSGNPENSAGGALDPKSGRGFGVCGGPNRDALLQQFGVVGWAWSPTLKPESEVYAHIGIFEFPTAQAAKSYIEAVASQRSCGNLTHEAIETGDNITPDQNSDTPRVDLFSGDDDQTKWEVREVYTTGGPLKSSPTFGITGQQDTEYIARVGGTTYGKNERAVTGHEQYLNLVIRYNIQSECCNYGFSNAESMPKDNRKSLADLEQMSQLFRSKILNKLSLDTIFATASTTTLVEG